MARGKVSATLAAGGLVSSVFHLGRPERAWRALAGWRHSWLSREVGAAFQASVLSRGNEEDPMELYKTFMGREPSQAALLKRAGLVAA